MIKLKALLKASHFGPTLIVTTIGFGFSWYYLNFFESLFVAFGIFTGQLVVGWSNDLYDLADDLKHQRLSKPLVVESINTDYLINWLKIMTPLSFALNLLGPLGLEGGLVYQLGIACGVAFAICGGFCSFAIFDCYFSRGSTASLDVARWSIAGSGSTFHQCSKGYETRSAK